MNLPPQIPRSPAFFGAIWSRQTMPFFLKRAARNYGDLLQLREGLWLASHPDLVQQILVANPTKWSKARGVEKTKSLLGEGLLGSGGELHRSRRRLLQPLFAVARLPFYADAIVECAQETRAQWHDGLVVDMHEQMSALALRIVARSVFGSGIEGQEAQVSEALDVAMRLFNGSMTPLGDTYERLPWVRNRFMQARTQLDDIVYGLIEQKRREGAAGEGVLDILLRARDEDGQELDDESLRDEAMTLLLAGHETTANALTFAWWFLGRYPAVRRKLEAEVDDVLGERRAVYEDLPRLTWTRAVLSEAMRLLPPAWAVGRRAVEDNPVTVNGKTFVVPSGTTVLMSSFVLHRDPRFWKQPNRFLPSRWTEEGFAPAKWSYLPFGAGSRACLAENFAWMEATLALATLAQEFRVTSGVTLKLEPSVTLRPRGPLPLCIEKR